MFSPKLFGVESKLGFRMSCVYFVRFAMTKNKLVFCEGAMQMSLRIRLCRRTGVAGMRRECLAVLYVRVYVCQCLSGCVQPSTAAVAKFRAAS